LFIFKGIIHISLGEAQMGYL